VISLSSVLPIQSKLIRMYRGFQRAKIPFFNAKKRKG
jgi:hypothetical protein